MIFGIGTDVCDIRRIRETYARRGERFAAKVLGPHEIEVFRQRLAKVESRGISYLATRFSAKEAFSQAIGVTARWSRRPAASPRSACTARWPSGSSRAACARMSA